MNTVGERIKDLRTQAKMTQSDLAAKVELTYVQIDRYEKRGLYLLLRCWPSWPMPLIPLLIF
jgi:DNA-binding XRE family transcriptional regulator